MSATIDPNVASPSHLNGESHGKLPARLSTQASRANFWRDGAPKKVVGEKSWEIWSRHLAKRKSPLTVDQLCGAKGTALVWGLNPAQLPAQTFELLQLVVQANGKTSPNRVAVTEALTGWLSGTSTSPQSLEFALECLAVANLLPRIATTIDGDLWWSVLDALGEVVEQSQDWQIDADVPGPLGLAHQLLVGELPLTLAHLFPEIRPLNKLRTAAWDTLAAGLVEFLNGAGLPRAGFLPVFRALIACWTRCCALTDGSKKNIWSNKAEEQFQMAVTKSLCLSSSTGDALLCGEDVPRWTADFLATVLHVGGDAADRGAARDLFDKKLTKQLTGKTSKRVPEFSESCEWSSLATLRTEYGRDKAVLAIDYSSPQMKIDLWSGSQRLLCGIWSTETTVSGRQLTAVGNWEETCWFSDPDVDYIELSIELDGGARLERQIALARKDKFLLLVDNVMNAPGESIHHRLCLPFGAGVGFVPEAETREGYLMADKPLAKVLPLGLPEWRIDPRVGELTSAGEQLQLVQERPGKNLSCPLFIDLDPKRLGKDCTWRQLTVAQSLEIQPHDVAVGYRIQCGKNQWLVYRSQAAPANRTVLGYNLSIEGVIGRFLSPSGAVEELLQVEG
ncbi:MAG: hypothetical protein SH868_14695 [Bythopirellula sp.]|nr:hypothetical protein [Bythopirellula sp.]